MKTTTKSSVILFIILISVDFITFTISGNDLVEECGKVQTIGGSLVRFGQNTSMGDWPWHAAIYLKSGSNLQYLCGGSLLTQFHVVTAAHCVTETGTSKVRSPDELLLYLGLHSLKTVTADVQKHMVSNIYVHPDYAHTPLNDDIALIKVKTYVEFTEFVWPICLWKDNADISNYIDKIGVVVGWGFDENNDVTDKLKKANLPIIAFPKCLASDKEFFSKHENQKVYCAGYRNGTSICSGDSGGGMYFQKKNDPHTWQLRGLVSIGAFLPGTQVCHASHYVLFTDVAKYIEWIKQTAK